MRPATLLRAAHARQPMIHFLGKRSHEKGPHTPKAHPQAPKEVAESFQSFLAKLQSSAGGAAASPSSTPKNQSSSSSSGAAKETSKGSGKPVDYEVFYEAPSRLWKTKPLEEFEMEAIMSGGATNVSA